MDKSVYYKVDTDIDALYPYDSLDDHTVLHITDQVWGDPLEDGGDFYGQNVARASDEEHTRWTEAYQTFLTNIGEVTARRDAAQKAYEKALKECEEAAGTIWAAYKGTVDRIQARNDEVEEMREAHRLNEISKQEIAAKMAQDAEDAELGPRTWVTYHPNSSEVKTSPTMLQPVIHLAVCPMVADKVDRNYQTKYHYARRDRVQDVLLKGAPLMSDGRATQDRVPTKLCGRCKPHASLSEALGEVFDNWLVEVESVQEPMPKIGTQRQVESLAQKLGLADEWKVIHQRKEGFSPMSDWYFRSEKIIEPYEMLIGWAIFDEHGKSVISESHEDKLERLIKELPARGFTARRVNEPQAYNTNGRQCRSSVAVRRMTKHEIRMYKG